MSFEISPNDTPERIPEYHLQQPAVGITSGTTSFEQAPEPTSLTPAKQSAIDIQPEVPSYEYKPSAALHERAVLGEQPMYIVSPTGEYGQKEVAPTWLQKAWQNKYIPIRTTLFRDFPSQSEGMDIARSDAFIRRLGLPATSQTIELLVSEQDRLREALTGKIDEAEHIDSRLRGCYMWEIDVVCTFRFPRREALMGAGYSEKTRIHELVHSSDTQEADFIATEKGLVAYDIHEGIATQHIRDGQASWSNLFISEGVAEMVAGDYVAQELGLPHGLVELPTDTAVVTANHDRERLLIPSRYTGLRVDGQLDCGHPAFAAAALDELVTKDPSLRLALIHSGHDREAWQEATDRLNAIQPGLSGTLRDNFTSPDQFKDGLRYVRDILDIPNH